MTIKMLSSDLLRSLPQDDRDALQHPSAQVACKPLPKPDSVSVVIPLVSDLGAAAEWIADVAKQAFQEEAEEAGKQADDIEEFGKFASYRTVASFVSDFADAMIAERHEGHIGSQTFRTFVGDATGEIGAFIGTAWSASAVAARTVVLGAEKGPANPVLAVAGEVDRTSSSPTGSGPFQAMRKTPIVQYPKYLLRLVLPLSWLTIMALSDGALAQERADTGPPASFTELGGDLAQMSNFFGGGQDASQPVTFDIEAARAAGFREESILLAADLAGFSNQIVQAQRDAVEGKPAARNAVAIGDKLSAATTAGYPRVEKFFRGVVGGRVSSNHRGSKVSSSRRGGQFLLFPECLLHLWMVSLAETG